MNMKKTKLETVPELPKEMSREMPKEMADFAQKSVDQAQAAFDKVSELAHGNVQAFDAAAGAFKARTLDLQMKAIEIAQANVNSAFGFFRRALAVRDPRERAGLRPPHVVAARLAAEAAAGAAAVPEAT